MKDVNVKETPSVSTVSAEVSCTGSTQCSITPHPQIIANELLAYICHYRSRSTQAALAKVVCSVYTSVEITAAKKCVTSLFHESLSDSIFMTDRRSSTNRSAHEAKLDDMLGAIDLLDNKDLLRTVIFAAVDLSRLPANVTVLSKSLLSRVGLYCIVFSDRQADLNYCFIVLYACTCIFVVLFLNFCLCTF